jgi:hypothetical protein
MLSLMQQIGAIPTSKSPTHVTLDDFGSSGGSEGVETCGSCARVCGVDPERRRRVPPCGGASSFGAVVVKSLLSVGLSPTSSGTTMEETA